MGDSVALQSGQELIIKIDQGGGILNSSMIKYGVMIAVVVVAVLFFPNLSASLGFDFGMISGGGTTEAAPPETVHQNWFKFECATFGICTPIALSGVHNIGSTQMACNQDQLYQEQNNPQLGTCIDKSGCQFSNHCDCSKVCETNTQKGSTVHASVQGNVVQTCPQGCGRIDDVNGEGNCCVCECDNNGIGGYPSKASCEETCSDIVKFNTLCTREDKCSHDDNPYWSSVASLNTQLTVNYNEYGGGGEGQEFVEGTCSDACPALGGPDQCFDTIFPIITQHDGRGMAGRALFVNRTKCEYAVEMARGEGELPYTSCDGGNMFNFDQSLCNGSDYPQCTNSTDCTDCINAQLANFIASNPSGSIGQCYACNNVENPLACAMHADHPDMSECEQNCGNPYVMGCLNPQDDLEETSRISDEDWIKYSKAMGVCMVKSQDQILIDGAFNQAQCELLGSAKGYDDSNLQWVPMYLQQPEPVILNLATSMTVRNVNTYLTMYHELGVTACANIQNCAPSVRTAYVRQYLGDDALVQDGIPDPFAVRLLNDQDFPDGENHVFQHGLTFYNAELPAAGPVFTVDQARALELNAFTIDDIIEAENGDAGDKWSGVIIPGICYVGTDGCNPGPVSLRRGDNAVEQSFWPSSAQKSQLTLPDQCVGGVCDSGPYARSTGRTRVTDVLDTHRLANGWSAQWVHGYSKYTLQSLTDSFDPIQNITTDEDLPFNRMWLENDSGDGNNDTDNKQKPPVQGEPIISGQFWTPLWYYGQIQGLNTNFDYGPNFCGCVKGECVFTDLRSYSLNVDPSCSSIGECARTTMLNRQNCASAVTCVVDGNALLINENLELEIGYLTSYIVTALGQDLYYAVPNSSSELEVFTETCTNLNGNVVHGQWNQLHCNNNFETGLPVEHTCSTVGQFTFRKYLLSRGLEADLVPKGLFLVEWNNDTATKNNANAAINPAPQDISGDVCQGKGPLGDTVRDACANMSTSHNPSDRFNRGIRDMGYGEGQGDVRDAELAARGRTMITAPRESAGGDGACASTLSYPNDKHISDTSILNDHYKGYNAQISDNKLCNGIYAWQQQVSRGPLINLQQEYQSDAPAYMPTNSRDMYKQGGEAVGGLSNLGYNSVLEDDVGRPFYGVVQNYPLPSGWVSHTMLTDNAAQRNLNKFDKQISVHGQVSSFCNVDLRAQAGDNNEFALYNAGTKLTQVAFWKSDYLNALLSYYREMIANNNQQPPDGSFPKEPLPATFIYTKDGWYERAVSINPLTGGVLVGTWWTLTDRSFGEVLDEQQAADNPYDMVVNRKGHDSYYFVNKLYMNDLPDELVRIHPRLFPSFQEASVNNYPAYCQSMAIGLNGDRCHAQDDGTYCCENGAGGWPECDSLETYFQEVISDTNPGSARITPESGLASGTPSLPGCGVARDADGNVLTRTLPNGDSVPIMCIDENGNGLKDNNYCKTCIENMEDKGMCMSQLNDSHRQKGSNSRNNCQMFYNPRMSESDTFQHQSTYCGLKEARLSYWCGNMGWHEYQDEFHTVSSQSLAQGGMPRFHLYDYNNNAQVAITDDEKAQVSQSNDAWRLISTSTPGLTYTPVQYFNWPDNETPWSRLSEPRESNLNAGMHARSSGSQGALKSKYSEIEGISGNVGDGLTSPFIQSDERDSEFWVDPGVFSWMATPLGVFEARNNCWTSHRFSNTGSIGNRNNIGIPFLCTIQGRNNGDSSFGNMIDRCNSGRYTQLSQTQGFRQNGFHRARLNGTYVCA